MRQHAAHWALAGLICLAGIVPATAQQSDGSRGVRIIEETPGGAVPSQPGPVSAPPMGDVDIRNMAIRTDNSAGLELTILPDIELATGTKVEFRIATKKQGYLILVDIDPTGKLTQIYPNRHMLETRESRDGLNLIKPGAATTIPNRVNPFAGFEYVAAPPHGVAMVVAVLSDKPVHLVDLPDVVPPQSGQAAFDQLYEVARRLKIAREDSPGGLEEPKWSFDAKLYVVR